MKILALDLATTTGWALGTPESPPMLGSFRCPKVFDDDTLGQRWAKFALWLDDMITVHKPDLVGFEAPLVFGGAKGSSRPTNIDTIRFLIGLATIAELVAVQLSTEVEDAHIQQVRAHFCGSGRAKKPDVQAMCFRRGLKPADDNQADAIAILSFLQHCHGCPAPWARELPKVGGGLLVIPGTTELRRAQR
jgi:Holliday junction resolvasome RuvABC endonuclease subunit